MAAFNVLLIIKVLDELASSTQFDVEQIDEAIDALEHIKNTINEAEDEVVDRVDEIQDYLQYLLADKQPVMSEIKEELANVIDDLKQWAK